MSTDGGTHSSGGQMTLVTPRGARVDSVRYPDIADLMSRLRFTPGDGRILLDEQRMLLLHAESMGTLRRELIESLGIDAARGLLTRMGYNSGARDAELARRVRPDNSIMDMFAVGPPMSLMLPRNHVLRASASTSASTERSLRDWISLP